MADVDELRGYLQRAVAELRETRAALRSRHEPIVVLGASCRYPGGVTSVEDLWQLVSDGRDAISPPPAERGWPSDAHAGGYLDALTEFDPAFFGLTADQAVVLDPQQRLLLETSWEAITESGLDPSALRGSRTGVFVGSMYNDFYYHWRDRLPQEQGAHLVLGSSTSMTAGRLSYTFGFHSASVAVDTACSSGVVALHQAVSALRRNECDLALVAGVSIAASPAMFDFSHSMDMLSPSAKCRSFADGADGWALSEGAATVVLQRQSDHERGELPALAVIRGVAVNHVGGGPGLALPATAPQVQVIEAALADAGLTAEDVDVVEGHGTGTPLGDAVEVTALSRAYGAHRPADRPLWLGSLKSNLGHTQAAGGLGGLLKMAMAMRHGVIPQSLHADNPSRHIDWDRANIRLVDRSIRWPAEGRPRRAAVSSFGISGTNTHVVLEEPAPDVAGRRSSVARPRYRRARFWPSGSAHPTENDR
ncbi:candicidin polyketide synthase FscE [Lentzea xinjiangensis]|uniref:Candicidin polyketide synthase FscE n=1 Tax=Lentzea xinjiangensis TaxID=402600 RepID=A0A1H9NJS6_9PSEU|nr:polyketide synthase [Lentzea xinjiangensis]SER36151.1 candicidin polyketide synthase FscE [Lentzea xinjiangensis]